MNHNPLSEESREQKLQSPEQIGSTLKVTALPTYILAVTALLLMGAFFVWGFLGSVSDKAYYSGKARRMSRCPTGAWSAPCSCTAATT